MTKFEQLLDQMTDFLWTLFEQDMRTTEMIMQRTETIVAMVGSKMPSSVRHFFND